MTDAELHDLQDKELHIRQLVADITLKQLDAIKRGQDIYLGPRQFWVSALGAAAACFGGGAALFAVLVKWLQH